MKKLIASACALTALVFTSALAHADDSSGNVSSSDNMHSSDVSQHPGISSSDTTTSTVDENGNKMSASTSTTKLKDLKTCTDAKGVVYYNGKKGFDHCVAQMKKNIKKNEQMGGTSGSDLNTSDSSSVHDSSNIDSSAHDMNNNSGSNSTDSSTSSNAPSNQ